MVRTQTKVAAVTTQSEELSKTKKNRKYIFKLLIAIIIVGLTSTSYYYFKQYKKIKENPNSIAQEEVKAVIAQISKIMSLPEGEDPTLATVSDIEKLKDQDFFKKSANGDKILIYAAAKQAILYRPSSNMIIQVAPLLIDQGADQGLVQNSENIIAEDSKESDLRVIIQNGTSTLGLARETEKKISTISGVKVVDKGNSQKDNYSKTLVINLSKKNSQLVDEIITAVDGEISELPEGETMPENVDVLVIAGK